MWNRIKLKVSRSRNTAPAPNCDEQQDSVDDEMTLTGLNKVSLSNSSDFVFHSHQDSAVRFGDQAQAVADEAICPSSMVHGFSNHSFGSLMNQQQVNGNHFVNNRVCSDTDMLHRLQTASSEQQKTVDSCIGFAQNDGSLKGSDSDRFPNRANCNGYAADESYKVASDNMQVVQEMSKTYIGEPFQRVCSSPPKLMRREKVKTGEVAESRRSRLSCHMKNSTGSDTGVPKPLELPSDQKPTDCGITPDDMLTNRAVFADHIFSTTVVKKPDVMLGSSSTEESQISTEPSTAESTDSGIQPSLCSGNEDKGLNSSGAEDDFRDDSFSECFASQNSDYMLLEDAKAMMSSSLLADGSCTDYIDHFVVKSFSNTHGSTTSDVCTNHKQQVSVDYIPYCENVTVLRRVNPVDEKKVQPSSHGSKADYVPVDSSFAALYSGQPLSAKQSKTVTRGTNTDDHLPLKNHVSHYSSKPACSLNGPLTISMECDRGNGNKNAQMHSQQHGFDMDSDDDSYLPPLPSRNYRITSERYAEDMSVSSEMVSSQMSIETDNEEKTHMSWEEVMKEAHSLGIPLSAPRTEVSEWKSSVSIASSEMSDCVDNPAPYRRFDCMSSSEHSAVAGSFVAQDKDTSNTSQCDSPSKISALAKCASPFKEKFRLHNLFSKKKNKKTDIVDSEVKDSSRIVQRHSSAAAEIQRRNLPPLPPKRRQASGSNMSRSSLDPIPPSSEFSRQNAHRTLSTLTLPAQENASAMMTGSVWAGSSSSVGPQREMSDIGICSRSISGMESNRDFLIQGKIVHHVCSLA